MSKLFDFSNLKCEVPRLSLISEKKIFPIMHLHRKTEVRNRDVLSAVTAAAPAGNRAGHWWRDRNLRTLNFLLFIPFMSQYVQGYDAR